MKREVNVTSKEWCDIVFQGKNKEYGAYVLRQSSSKRHIIALFLMLGFVTASLFLLNFLNLKSVETALNKPEPLPDYYIAIPESQKIPVIFTTPDATEEQGQKVDALIQEELISNRPVTIIISELGGRFIASENDGNT